MEKTAILFIHGFIGSSSQFSGIREELADCGADLIVHTLSGHGGSLAEFRNSGAQQWQDSVDDKIDELSVEYERLILVGHSMGGLLAVRAAVRRPEKIAAVVGIGFPIKISISPGWIKLNSAASKPPVPGEDPRITAARKMAGVPIKSVGQYLSTLPQNIEFLKVVKLAGQELSLLKAPLTVINFEKDEIVSPKVNEFVKKKLPWARIILLKKSYHFLFDKEEQSAMAETIQKML